MLKREFIIYALIAIIPAIFNVTVESVYSQPSNPAPNPEKSMEPAKEKKEESSDAKNEKRKNKQIETGIPSSAIFSANGTHVLIRSDKSVSLISLSGQKVIGSMEGGHLLYTFSSNNKYAVIASREGFADVWNLEDGKKHRADVVAPSILLPAPDDTFLFLSLDGSIVLWDPSGQKTISVLRGRRAVSMAVHPSWEAVYAGNEDGSVTLWDLKNSRELLNFPATSGEPLFLHYDENTGTLLVGDRNGYSSLLEGSITRILEKSSIEMKNRAIELERKSEELKKRVIEIESTHEDSDKTAKDPKNGR